MAAKLAFTHDALWNHAPLPTGRCQYFDLASGHGAPVCPCQRFYRDTSHQTVFCFCGHHACFHGPASGPASFTGSVVGSIAATQSTVPLCSTIPLEPVQTQTPTRPLRSDSPTAQAYVSIKSTATPPHDIWGAYREHMRQQRERGLVENSSALPSTAPAFTPSRSPPTSDEPGVSLRELQNITAANSKRLDALESLSYSHVPLEEVEDKFQSHDTRIGALEDFRAEVSSSVAGGYLHTVPSAEADPSEYDSRLRGIEESVESLSDLCPTYERPWNIEVVLLPWGRSLLGIWSQGASDDSLPRTLDQWDRSNTAAPTMITESFSDRSSWSHDSIQAWLSSSVQWVDAKACGPSSLVWERLHSRGLIRHIEVTSNDALSLMQKCRSAFDPFLRSIDQDEDLLIAARDRYDALNQPLIPLRKVKKESKLHFLSPSEMVTSATWTPSMLDTSVFMKARGLRRLYVTTPAAYVQSADNGLTWEQIRGHPHVERSSRAGCSTDLLEECWKAHVVLDAASPGLTCSAHPTKRKHDTNVDEDPGANRGTHSLHVSQQPGEQELDQAMTMTVGGEDMTLPGTQDERHTGLDETKEKESKRRRLSASPNTARPGPSRVSRLSREPSLPFTSDGYLDQLSVGRTINTPVAYPTPLSHHIHTISTVRMVDEEGDLFANVSLRELSPFRTSEQSQGSGEGGAS